MKAVGQIMQELGFNKESSDAAKEAFIRHLVKAATGVTPQPRKKESQLKLVVLNEQLTFESGTEAILESCRISVG